MKNVLRVLIAVSNCIFMTFMAACAVNEFLYTKVGLLIIPKAHEGVLSAMFMSFWLYSVLHLGNVLNSVSMDTCDPHPEHQMD